MGRHYWLFRHDMKKYRVGAVNLVLMFSVLAGFLSPIGVAFATIYSAGSLLQIGDVKTEHILDGTIKNVDINSTAAISGTKVAPGGAGGNILYSASSQIGTSSSLKYATSTGDLYVFGGRIHATSTNFNSVSYNWPSADGAANQVLSTSGAGVLSWASPASTQILATSTAGQSITVGQAVFIEDSSTFDTTEYQSNSATNNDINQGCGKTTTDSTHGTQCAQKFTASSSYSATKVLVYLAKQGSPTDNAVIAVQADSSGSPSGTDLATATKSGASLTTSSAAYTLTLSGSVSITSGQTYWIVLRRDSSTDNTNYYLPSSGVYSGSSFYVKSSGGTWSAGTDLKSWHIETMSTSVEGNAYIADAATSGKYAGFTGFAASSVSSGETLSIVVAGIASSLSGLSAGKQYYLSNTPGAIGTSAGTNSRKVCLSLTSSSCLVTNIW